LPEAIGKESYSFKCNCCPKSAIENNLTRTNNDLENAVNFNSYHSETEFECGILKKIERKDLALNHFMISPWAPCTMKFERASEMLPISLARWGNIHPFCTQLNKPEDIKSFKRTGKSLNIITGFAELFTTQFWSTR